MLLVLLGWGIDTKTSLISCCVPLQMRLSATSEDPTGVGEIKAISLVRTIRIGFLPSMETVCFYILYSRNVVAKHFYI